MVRQIVRDSSRRGFLGWAGRVGVTTIGAVAGLTATQATATADGRCNRTPFCCCLKRTNDCAGTAAGFTCPSGWTKRTWNCCWFASPISPGATYGCGECVKGGTNCFNATSFTCSKYWLVHPNRCPA